MQIVLGGHRRQAREYVFQIFVGIVAVATAGADERVEDGSAVAGRGMADKQPVRFSNRGGTGTHHYEPVQLKEIVPETVNVRQTLEELLADIGCRYCTGEVLTNAIHLNRDLVTTLGKITPPALSGVTFWLFGLCDANRGFLAKDPFGGFEVVEFEIPRAPSSITQW